MVLKVEGKVNILKWYRYIVWEISDDGNINQPSSHNKNDNPRLLVTQKETTFINKSNIPPTKRAAVSRENRITENQNIS